MDKTLELMRKAFTHTYGETKGILLYNKIIVALKGSKTIKNNSPIRI